MAEDAEKKSTRLEDLAAQAGVSISTVSRALNDSPAVNRQTKQRVWRVAQELGYAFRGHMPAGPLGAKGVITVVVPRPQSRLGRLADPFLFELLASIGETARERTCDVLLSHIAPVTRSDLSYALDTSAADGLVFIGQRTLHNALNDLTEHTKNFVVWGAEFPEQRYCSIGSDNQLGGERATSHLLRLGRKRVCFLGDRTAPEAQLRYRGYLVGHDKMGVPADPGLMIETPFDMHAAAETVNRLLNDGVVFDGVIAASDLIAIGAMQALQKNGVAVPDAISVVGYDDIPFARLCTPALTTISQNVDVGGRLIVSKLLDGAAGMSASERTPTTLIVRGSCGG